MTSSMDVAQKGLSFWRQNYGDASLDQQCQRYDGYYWQWAYQGNENIRTYGTATAAANASTMYSTNINAGNVAPGDLANWWWNPDGHVGTVLGIQNGRVLVTHTSSKGDTVYQLTNHVKVSHADTIGLSFRGYSKTNGANRQRSGLSAWTPGGGGTPVSAAYGLTTATQRDLQRALTKLGLYSGPVDGVFGENSVKGMQRLLISQGLLATYYTVDGVPGPNYGLALQELAYQYGYRGPMDGIPGANTSNYLSVWAAKVMGETAVVPPTPPVKPPLPIPAAWEKTYPAASSIVRSPNREARKEGAYIRMVIFHGTANPVDHTAYFARQNEREVAPNLYGRPSGEVKECVRLGERAWTTGVAADHNAVTWELESDNTTYTDEQYEAAAQFCAWLSQQEIVDGSPVNFTISRQNIIGHREAPGVTNGTSCPGKLDLDRIVARALELVAPQNPDTITLSREIVLEWASRAGVLSSDIERALE